MYLNKRRIFSDLIKSPVCKYLDQKINSGIINQYLADVFPSLFYYDSAALSKIVLVNTKVSTGFTEEDILPPMEVILNHFLVIALI